MTRCRLYLAMTASLSLLLAVLGGWATQAVARHHQVELPMQQRLVGELGLTDLAIWTEARYTRHPSMADLFSPFQDHPGAFEHFPAGSILAPVSVRPTTTLRVERRRRAE